MGCVEGQGGSGFSSRWHYTREGTALGGGAQSGSQCQVGKTEPLPTDERSDLYSEGDGKLRAGE